VDAAFSARRDWIVRGWSVLRVSRGVGMGCVLMLGYVDTGVLL
jgi:hypothetical protein